MQRSSYPHSARIVETGCRDSLRAATELKDAARSEAIRRRPAKADLFARLKDDGRAEAALIAIAGMQREGVRR